VEETKDPNYQTELDKARGGKLMLKLEHGGSVVSEQEIIGSFPGVEEMLGPVYTLADIQAVNVDEGSSTKLLQGRVVAFIGERVKQNGFTEYPLVLWDQMEAAMAEEGGKGVVKPLYLDVWDNQLARYEELLAVNTIRSRKACTRPPPHTGHEFGCCRG
jgi:hypothetical protein